MVDMLQIKLVLVMNTTHVGIPGSESANALTKKAAASGKSSGNTIKNEVGYLISRDCQELPKTWYLSTERKSYYKII